MPAGGVQTSGLAKCFGSVRALDGVDLDIEPGEIVAIVGPNGAGKTTLVRILGTTVLPDAGSASVAGYDVVTEGDAVRRVVGLALGEDRALFWRLSGRRNLEFFAALHGLARREGRLRVGELLELVDLAEVGDRRVDRYSTGMRARLGLARALLGEPQVLLLDEPTRSLDPLAAVSVRALMQRLTETERLAVLFTSHDLHEVSTSSNRVLVMVAGRIAVSSPGGTDPVRLEQAMLDAVG